MTTATRWMACTLALTAWLGPAGPVAAQDAEYEARIARAREVFQRGEQEFRQHRYSTAAESYEEAYDLMEGHPNRYLQLFNIGQAHAAAGSYEAALGWYERYLEEGGELVENRGEVETLMREYCGRVSSCGDEPTTAASEPSGPDMALLGTGVALAGLGGLGLVAMGVLGGLALAEQQSLECAETTTCTEDDIAASNDLALGADISLVAGSVLAAAGLALIVVAVVTQPSADEPVAFAPYVSPEGAGLVGRASW